MSYALRLAALLIFVLALFPLSEAKTVLILNSYHQGYKWTDDITAGIRSALNNSGTDIIVNYMDTKRISSEEYFVALKELYRAKYLNREPDLIISSDDDALNFLLKYRDEVFPGVPVVFCGTNYFDPARLTGLHGITGVNEEADMASTIDLVLKFHPGTERILLVTDLTVTGEHIRVEYAKLQERFRNVVLDEVGNLTFDVLIRQVIGLDKGTVVLFAVYSKDKDGLFTEYDTATSSVAAASPVPVYGVWDFSLGYGIVGGMLTSGRVQGESAGYMAMRILKGQDPESIPVMMQSPNVWMFDYTEMQKAGLAIEDVPPDSAVINRPADEINLLRQRLIVSSLLLVSVLIMLGITITSNRKWRKAESELRLMNSTLELRVRDRTVDMLQTNRMLKAEIKDRSVTEKALASKNEELERFMSITVNREERMRELKKEIAALKGGAR